jgi:TRAP-type mannitol/chloroaromatic compound transport system substrate-binding protein
MDRRHFLAAGLGAAALLPAPALAQTPPQVQWRLASSFPSALAPNSGVEFLCARVAALTDNRFQITPSADLAPPLGVLDATQAGTIEMGLTSLGYSVEKEPAFGFAAAVPFGLTARQQMAWLVHGGYDLTSEVLKAHGCLGLPAGNTGAEMGGWYLKEIRSADDLKGLKIGISGLGGTVLAAMGAEPQAIAAADLAGALGKGTIAAAAWVGPYDDEKLGLNKAAKLYYCPGWWAGNEMLWAVINLDKWRDLPPTYKAALEVACWGACSLVQARYDAENPAALKRLLAAGVQVRPYPPDLLEAAAKATAAVMTDLAAKNAAFKKIYDGWKPFREAEGEWFGTAEAHFESALHPSAPQPAPAK